MLEQRSATEDDFPILVGSTLIILVLWAIAGVLF